jgi:opacity protein-like surface antigen
MKYISFLLSLLCVFGFASLEAKAQTSRIYFAGYMGLTSFGSVDFTDHTTPVTGSFEPENAVNFAGALGLRFSENLRLEAELSHRGTDFDTADISGTGATVVDGDLQSTVLLLNTYYDFDIRDWRTQPYLTAGIGVGRHNGQLTDPGAFTTNVNDTAYGFMWNVGAGVKYRVRDNFAWTAGYRYLDGTSIALGNTEIDASNHEIRLGLEWDLGY